MKAFEQSPVTLTRGSEGMEPLQKILKIHVIIASASGALIIQLMHVEIILLESFLFKIQVFQ